MKKILLLLCIIVAVGIYSFLRFDNPYKDKIVSYWQRFELTQDIGASDTVDYTMLASGLQDIIAINPSRYKPYEFAALFASTLNKLNPTISTANVDRLITIAAQGLEKDCDVDALRKVLASSIAALSGLNIPDTICQHKQLPTLLALIYTTYKSDKTYAQKLYFLAEHAAQ